MVTVRTKRYRGYCQDQAFLILNCLYTVSVSLWMKVFENGKCSYRSSDVFVCVRCVRVKCSVVSWSAVTVILRSL